MYKAIIAIGIVAATYLAAGCGGGSDQTATAVVTTAQFIEQAEGICIKARDGAQKAAAAWEKEAGRKLDLDSALTDVLGPVLKKETEELQSLALPKEDQAEIARMFGNLSRTATALMKDPNSRTSSDSAAGAAFAREVKAYGLEACQI